MGVLRQPALATRIRTLILPRIAGLADQHSLGEVPALWFVTVDDVIYHGIYRFSFRLLRH
jgi:hypothetical protein